MEIARPVTGEVRTTLDERVQATYAALKAKGREEGLEQGIRRGFVRERESLISRPS